MSSIFLATSIQTASVCVLTARDGMHLQCLTGDESSALRAKWNRCAGAYALIMCIRRSTTLLEYPHSLSYQDTTLKNRFSPGRLFCRVALES